MNPLKYAHFPFPTQLHLWETGRLEPRHFFALERPMAALQQAGFDDAPLLMTQETLRRLADLNDLGLTELAGLGAAILDPVLAFDSITRLGWKVLLTELPDFHGPSPLGVVELGRTLRGQVVSDVRSVYPSDALTIELWIEQGLTCYAHPQRSRAWLKKVIFSDVERLAVKLGLSSIPIPVSKANSSSN